MSDEFVAVLRTETLGPGKVAEVEVGGRPIVLVNAGQTYFALDGICPEDGTRLGQGATLNEDDELVCPGDGARFDVHSGTRFGGKGRLQRYALRIEGNEVLIGPALD